MDVIALIDFGSTNTKVTAVDADAGRIVGTACAFTTVSTDIGAGLAAALSDMEKSLGCRLNIVKRFACSSAAGGLRMVVSGLVPNLTAEAGRLASLGAGAKVIRAFSYDLTDEDVEEIVSLKPDIFLLTGGANGGNKECIIGNSKALAAIPAEKRFPVIIAGNRSAAATCEKALAGWDLTRCPNVMPAIGQLNIDPVQAEIRNLFLKRIIHAKGLSKQADLIEGILMPTPEAVKLALELLGSGIGDLIALDPGGATTDVYSIADGMPRRDNVVTKGLPEPHSKRTVEGDIGMRYSAKGVLEAIGGKGVEGIPSAELRAWVEKVSADPSILPANAHEHEMDFELACGAVETAVVRHAGTVEEEWTPLGQVYVQTGKDLTTVEKIVLTGGALIHSERVVDIARRALYDAAKPASLRPKKAEVFVDKLYILAAMGLLAQALPELALNIMRKEIVSYGTAE